MAPARLAAVGDRRGLGAGRGRIGHADRWGTFGRAAIDGRALPPLPPAPLPPRRADPPPPPPPAAAAGARRHRAAGAARPGAAARAADAAARGCRLRFRPLPPRGPRVPPAPPLPPVWLRPRPEDCDEPHPSATRAATRTSRARRVTACHWGCSCIEVADLGPARFYSLCKQLSWQSGPGSAGRCAPSGSAARAGWWCGWPPGGSWRWPPGWSPAISSRWARTASSRWCLGQATVGVQRVQQLQPLRAGPCTMATAMARLSVTIGLSDIRSSSPYSARICGQSVSSTRAASSWIAAIAACSW